MIWPRSALTSAFYATIRQCRCRSCVSAIQHWWVKLITYKAGPSALPEVYWNSSFPTEESSPRASKTRSTCAPASSCPNSEGVHFRHRSSLALECSIGRPTRISLVATLLYLLPRTYYRSCPRGSSIIGPRGTGCRNPRAVIGDEPNNHHLQISRGKIVV